MSDTPVSIILRSYNEAWALRDTLPALHAQNHHDWELIAIDSGSTDGSIELLRRFAPRHLVVIPSEDYNPSRVLNQGMRLARHDTCLFLNADATPVDSNWLRPLAVALQHPRTAAAYSRQIARPDCRAVFAHDYERCFGPARDSAAWDHFFSMVGSGLRRDVWARRGFLESLQYSEDDEYTRWCRTQGYRIAYCPDSIVTHSHNYTPRQVYKRSFGEAWAAAGTHSGRASDGRWLHAVALGWLNDARRDFAYCLRERRLGEWPHALRTRWMQRVGRHDGYRAGAAVHGAGHYFRPGDSSAPTHASFPALHHPV